jgi:hypothetical protein
MASPQQCSPGTLQPPRRPSHLPPPPARAVCFCRTRPAHPQALQPLSDAFGGDITSVLGNPQQVNDFFSASVIPGRAAGLADLTNGAALTTLNGGTVTITVKT